MGQGDGLATVNSSFPSGSYRAGFVHIHPKIAAVIDPGEYPIPVGR